MREDAETLRREGGELWTMVLDAVRRVLLVEIADGQATTEGYQQDDGTFEGAGEPVDEFGPMYVYAKPGASDGAESVLLSVGGSAEHRVAVAHRNEAARLRYVAEHGDIADGEQALFNSSGLARVFITADGDVYITVASGRKLYIMTKGGTTKALATLEDVQHVRDDLNGHSHAYIPGSGGSAFTTGNPSVTAPVGTAHIESE